MFEKKSIQLIIVFTIRKLSHYKAFNISILYNQLIQGKQFQA